MDGNFSAEHLRQSRADDDVFLADGLAFAVGRQRYQEHLKVARDIQTVTHDVSFPSFRVLMLSRNPHAMTTRPSTGRMPIGTTSMSPASAPRPVLGTAVFARTVLWTSKRASSESELFVIVHLS